MGTQKQKGVEKGCCSPAQWASPSKAGGKGWDSVSSILEEGWGQAEKARKGRIRTKIRSKSLRWL
jgi:hypothetical protein